MSALLLVTLLFQIVMLTWDFGKRTFDTEGKLW